RNQRRSQSPLRLILPESIVMRPPRQLMFQGAMPISRARIETYQSLFANRKPCVVVPNGSFRQSGPAQSVCIFCIIFRPAKNTDAIFEIGKAHVGVELESAGHGPLRLLLSSGKCIARSGDSQRGQNVWPLPERLFRPSCGLLITTR